MCPCPDSDTDYVDDAYSSMVMVLIATMMVALAMTGMRMSTNIACDCLADTGGHDDDDDGAAWW